MRTNRVEQLEQPRFWSGTLAGMPLLLRKLGADEASVLDQVDPDCRRIFGSPTMAPVAQAVDLFNVGAAVTGCDDFGLYLGAHNNPHNSGAVGRLMLAAPTLGHMLKAWERHGHLVQQDGAFILSLDGAGVEIFYRGETDDAEKGRQDVEFSLASALCGMRVATGLRLMPTEVCFQHAAPDSTEAHTTFFGCPLRFGQPVNRVVLKRCTTLNHVAANTALFESLDEYLQVTQQGLADGKLGEYVRRMIAALLPEGVVSLQSVADHLNLSARTLQRRLDDSDGGFNELFDEVRRKLARRYVLETHLPMMQITQHLGFSESSAFTRSYLRWNGITPLRHRHRDRSS